MRNQAATAVAAIITIFGCDGVRIADGQCDYSLTTYKSSELSGDAYVSTLAVYDDGSGPALCPNPNPI